MGVGRNERPGDAFLTWFDARRRTPLGLAIACGPSRLVRRRRGLLQGRRRKSRCDGWTKNGFDLPRTTLTAETASGGKHYYYQASASHCVGKHDRWAYPAIERKLPGIDFRADGGLRRGPPDSSQPTAGEYRFTNGALGGSAAGVPGLAAPELPLQRSPRLQSLPRGAH